MMIGKLQGTKWRNETPDESHLCILFSDVGIGLIEHFYKQIGLEIVVRPDYMDPSGFQFRIRIEPKSRQRIIEIPSIRNFKLCPSSQQT